MSLCNRPGCTGEVDETGFCGTCFRRPLPGATPIAPTQGATAPTIPRSPADGVDLLALPNFEFPDPSSRIQHDPEVPERMRKCRECDGVIGRSYAGQPPVSEGFCEHCGHPYSFLPGLREGDLVADQYAVIGCFAHGGLGWVYLAKDRHLDNNLVVLKGLIDTGDAALVAAERQTLIRMDHRNIVRIWNFVTHPDPRSEQPRGYIVMEYVDGLTLGEVASQRALGSEPLRVDHVIACGLQILAAYEYLHGRELLYCDMKPENVIVRPGNPGEPENRIKLIDLGAARRFGDRSGKVIGTPGYQVSAAEINQRGLTVQSDIYALGVTLDRLVEATVDRDDDAAFGTLAVAIDSFRRLRQRARQPEPERRFSSAAEMSEQLRGVQREITSLLDGNERPTPLSQFAPTATLLDAGLGSVPPLERWTQPDRSRRTGEPLTDGRPSTADVAIGLPVPQVNPADPAADVVVAAVDSEPLRLLDKLPVSEYDTAEVRFARCRAYLELGKRDDAGRMLDQDPHVLGSAADYDWRLLWHEGLVALAHGKVGDAENKFDAVYDALPGETAPKLALAFCAECSQNPQRAEELYQAAWLRDRSQGSAAFGLARIRLSQGDRAGAVAVLDEVPKVSRHYDAATVAAVLVLSGQLKSGPPTVDDLKWADSRLTALYLDDGSETGEARDRLTALIREAAFGTIPGDARIEGCVVIGPDAKARRKQLEQSYRALARQARSPDDQGVLVDLANSIRPWTLR